MTDLNPAYAGQQAVNQQQQAAVPVKYDAQRTALTAEKGQGFNAINNQAVNRGGSFSGVPIDEQATYLSTKYLPGMQAANTQQNADQLALQGDAAKLSTEQANNALGIVQKQNSDLNSWNMQQDQLTASAREAALNRAASAAESAANRAASRETQVTPAQNASAALSAKTGEDGFVSQGTYGAVKQQWIISGYGTAGDFDNMFAGYRNPKNNQYKLG